MPQPEFREFKIFLTIKDQEPEDPWWSAAVGGAILLFIIWLCS